jgi:hypothetical protein
MSRLQPFRYPRARFHTSPRSQPLVPSQASGRSTFARGSGINSLPLSRKDLLNARRCAPRFNCSTRVSRVLAGVPPDSFRFVLSVPCALSPPRPHRAAAIRPDDKLIASALFGPRPTVDSSAWPPLHSTPRPLKMKQAPAAFVPLAANCRDNRRRHSGAPKNSNGREASPGHEPRLSREPGQLSLARNCPASLMVAHRKVCLRLRRQAAVLLPVHTLIPWWPSATTFALPPKTQNSSALALTRLASIESSRPGNKAIGYAAGWHERPARLTVLVIAGAARTARLWPRLANRQLRQHTLCVRSAHWQVWLTLAALLYPDRPNHPHS